MKVLRVSKMERLKSGENSTFCLGSCKIDLTDS